MKATKIIFPVLLLFLLVPVGAQQPQNIENGHEYVDLGLSVKWGTCNMGAEIPEDYGDYYAWGDKEESRILKHGNTTDSIVEHFNYKSGEFVRDKVTTYTFDRQARLISKKTEHVDTLNPVFPKIMIKEYSYDRNGRVKKIMEGDYWNDTTPFEKAFKSKLHYDNNSIYEKTYIIIHHSKRQRKYLVPRKELYAISKSYLDEQGRIILSETDYLTQ